MTITREQIIEAVKHQKRLPSIPDLVMRLEKELQKKDPSIKEVSTLIEQDPALSLRILSVANSVFYSRGKEASSVKQAMLRLGFAEIRRLAIAAVLVENYRDFCGGSPALFWGHSLAVGLAARALTEFCSVKIENEITESAFTCGLLHDLGVMAFGQLFPSEYQAVVVKVLGRGGELSEAEIDTFGIDHGEVGAILMKGWELPDVMCKVVEFHHRPWRCNTENPSLMNLIYLVHLSDFICNNQGYGRRRQLLPESFDHMAWDALGLSLECVPEIIEKVRFEGERSQVFMNAFG
jgi:two-component system, cell cycle response regulator